MFRLRQAELLQRGDRLGDVEHAALGIERAVGREQHLVGAEEIEAAARCPSAEPASAVSP